MATRTAPRQRPAPGLESGSRYERIWEVTVLLATAVWIAVAILLTPPVPLLEITAATAAWGGIFFIRAPASTVQARREYAGGVLRIAWFVLLMVGLGHQVAGGVATFAVFALSSPSVTRWALSQRGEDVAERRAARHSSRLTEPLGAQDPGAERTR
jgi:hypothetical protein